MIGKFSLRLRVKDLLYLAVTTGAILFAGWWLWTENVVQRVFLVNGLSVPVEIAVDGAVHRVAGQGRAELTLLRGVHQVKATSGNEVLEEASIDVPSTNGVVAYNLLGVAPLFNEAIVYGASTSARQPDFAFYGGQRLVVAPQADYVFTPPARSISVEKSSSRAHVRWHFDRAPGGWETTVSVLKDRGQVAAALRVCLEVSRHDPKVADALARAVALLQDLKGPEAAQSWVQQLVADHPDDFDLHRAYQHLLRRSDRFEEARAFYRTFAQERPSPLSRVLRARTEAPETAVLLYREALGSGEDDPVARRGLARLLLDLGRDEESVAEFERVAQNDPEYVYYVDDHVRGLFRLGKTKEALAVAAKAAEKHRTEWRLAVLYAEVAQTAGEVPLAPPQPAGLFIDQWAQKNREPAMGLWMRAVAGMGLDEAAVKRLRLGADPLVVAGRALQAVSLDPSQAWPLLAKAKAPTLERLSTTVIVLMAAEFHRVGDPFLADILLERASEVPLPKGAIVRYVMEGVEHPEMWRLDADLRAALDFVRSRRLRTNGDAATAEALLAAARAREGFNGLVHRCVKTWPPPRAVVARPGEGRTGS